MTDRYNRTDLSPQALKTWQSAHPDLDPDQVPAKSFHPISYPAASPAGKEKKPMINPFCSCTPLIPEPCPVCQTADKELDYQEKLFRTADLLAARSVLGIPGRVYALEGEREGAYWVRCDITPLTEIDGQRVQCIYSTDESDNI